MDPAGHVVARGEAVAAVAVDEALVEDHPGRLVLVAEAGGVELVEGPTERVVVGGLVGEAASLVVDHDRAGQGPLALDQLDAVAGVLLARDARDRDDRRPPGLAHHPQPRAHLHRHPQTVTGVARRSGRVVQRAAQEVADQAGVALEASGGQDDAAGRPHLPVTVRAALEADPDDAALLDDEVGRPAGGDDPHAPVEQSLEQGAEQPPPQSLEAARRPALLLLGGQEAGAAADGRLADVHRAADAEEAVRPVADLIEREQLRLGRAPSAGLPAGELGVVVGVAGHQAHPQRGARLDPLQHRVDGLEERLGHLRVDQVVGQRLEVRPRLRHAVLHAVLALQPVGRQPGDAAGERRRAAQQVALLVDLDPGAGVGGGQRRQQPGAAAAQHDDVDRSVAVVARSGAGGGHGGLRPAARSARAASRGRRRAAPRASRRRGRRRRPGCGRRSSSSRRRR